MSDELRTTFGRRVRQLREERSWGQEGFADRVGVHRTYMGDIERGRRNIGLDNIQKIARALGISLSDLFEGL